MNSILTEYDEEKVLADIGQERYEDGKAEKTEIEAGIYDDENMEVKSGLTSDSQVIVSWSNELVDQGEVLLAQDSDGAQTNGNNETAAETTEAGDKE